MVARDPLTRYWFIDQLARTGALAAIDQEGYITRPLQPTAPPAAPRPQPRYHSDIVRERSMREVFLAGDRTHTWPQQG